MAAINTEAGLLEEWVDSTRNWEYEQNKLLKWEMEQRKGNLYHQLSKILKWGR